MYRTRGYLHMDSKALYLMISDNIKTEILLSGKTKTEIAKAVGISKPTLSQYLSGRAQPSLPTFALLCRVLDASADEILNLTAK